jgi:heptosyltransferase-2
LAENLKRKARMALASLPFRLVRARELRGNPFRAPGPRVRVLVVRQQNQMGDMLLATPCLRALRECLPKSWITLVASDENEAVVRNNPYVDEVLVYSKKKFRANPLALFAFVWALNNRRFDVAVMLSTVSLSVTSALLCILSGARFRVTYSGESFGVGFVDGAFHFSFPIEDAAMHQTRLGLQLLEYFKITTHDLSPIMVPSEDDEKFAREFTSDLRPEAGTPPALVAIHPGAGKKKNRWPASRFAELARALGATHGAKILVMAGPSDAGVLEEMLANLDPRPVLLTGEPIGRVAAVMKRLDLLVCNDTGVLHVAASVGCPTLALFGPTDPARWAPLSKSVRTLRAPDGDLSRLDEEEVIPVTLEMLSSRGAAHAG